MLGPFTFTFTLESEEFEKFEKVGAADLYQPMITTRAPDGANKSLMQWESLIFCNEWSQSRVNGINVSSELLFQFFSFTFVGLFCPLSWAMDIACSLLCLRKFPTIQFRFLCILSGTLIKFIRLGTAVINLLDKLKRFSTELNFLQKQGAGTGVSDLSGSWKLQTDTFLYLFLIHSVFVYPEAIKFVGTLILAISVESLAAKSGRAEYSRSNHYSPPNQVQYSSTNTNIDINTNTNTEATTTLPQPGLAFFDRQ